MKPVTPARRVVLAIVAETLHIAPKAPRTAGAFTRPALACR